MPKKNDTPPQAERPSAKPRGLISRLYPVFILLLLLIAGGLGYLSLKAPEPIVIKPAVIAAKPAPALAWFSF